jgi:hypothetical protein
MSYTLLFRYPDKNYGKRSAEQSGHDMHADHKFTGFGNKLSKRLSPLSRQYGVWLNLAGFIKLSAKV